MLINTKVEKILLISKLKKNLYLMQNISLLVIAAGIGSRFGGLKQIASIGLNGESIIDYSVYDAIESGFNKVVFVIRSEFQE